MTQYQPDTHRLDTRRVDERSDNELLAAYAAGDTEAFGEFARRYDHFLIRVAARRIGGGVGVGSWHDAQDAAAEAWVVVMGHVGTTGALGPDGVGDVKNWLASFVRNTAVRITTGYALRRTPARDPHVLGEVISAQGYRLPGASGPAEPESDQDRQARDDAADVLAERFAQALAGLTPRQREVMSRRLHRRDLTARQIAADLGWTLEAVKSAEGSGLGRCVVLWATWSARSRRPPLLGCGCRPCRRGSCCSSSSSATTPR